MNPLITHNELLQEQNGWVPSGYVWLKAPNKSPNLTGDFFVIQVGWVGLKELAALMAFAKDRGWEGFSYNGFDQIDPVDLNRTDVLTPVCPDHKAAMSPSIHFDGFFCKRRANGGYCKREARRDGAGAYVVR